jgi:hypothetical protein
MEEIWKDIPGHEGKHQVSSYGRVKNIKRNTILKEGLAGRGILYKRCSIGYIHRLVALTFISNPHNLPEVGHKDNNPLNNCIENLEWTTHSDNAKNSIENYRKAKQGEKHPHTALSDSDVLKIRELRKEGNSCTELAKKYNVSANCISQVSTRTFKHLEFI